MKPGHAPQAVADRLGDPQILGAGLSLRVRPHLQRAASRALAAGAPAAMQRLALAAESPIPSLCGGARRNREYARRR
jgi:hypothetical protein